jgi:hypothetical protein
MKNLLLLLLIITSCKNKRSQNWLDTFEAELTKKDIFWQSVEKCDYQTKIEFFFRTDSTVIALNTNSHEVIERGRWIFDSESGILQIAWDKSIQTSVYVKGVADKFNSILFNGSIYQDHCGETIIKLNDIKQKASNL